MKGKYQLFTMAFAIMLLITLPLLAACGGDDEETPTDPTATMAPEPTEPEEQWVKMLDLTDLTGPASAALTPLSEGMHDYFDYINEQGGFEGVKVDFVTFDTKYDLATAQNAYQREKEGAVLVYTYSHMMDWLKEVTPQDKIVVASGSMTPSVSFPAQPYIYGVVVSTWDQTAGALRWYKENMWEVAGNTEPLKLGVVYTDAPAGKAYLAGTPNFCKEEGIDLVKMQPVPMGVTDMTPELLALDELEPDLIYFSMTIDGAMIGLKNRYDLGIDASVILAPPADVSVAMNALGDEICEGVYWSAIMAVESEADEYPLVDKAVGWWKERHPEDDYVNLYGLGVGYAVVIGEALERAVKAVGYAGLTGETLKENGFDSITERLDTQGIIGGFMVEDDNHIGNRWGKVCVVEDGEITCADWIENPRLDPSYF